MTSLANKLLIAQILCGLLLSGCGSGSADPVVDGNTDAGSGAGTGSLGDFDYANQTVPSYITKNNSPDNPISDSVASLGRVLFYDKKLSNDDSVSCASCHEQSSAFSDSDRVSNGVNGQTGRHSMRLINARFARESKFFWDERARDLETQTTMPVRDHGEMGFSGADGDPDFDALLLKLAALDYYQTLFVGAYGNSVITEDRMQDAMAQFVRSIQSFDSRYDAALVQNGGQTNQPFANFSAEENQGKTLFSQGPQFGPDGSGERTGGGLGCQICHSAPEFDIDPNSRNNGVIGVANGQGADTTNTRAPSLRDLFDANGIEHGSLMHDGSLATIDDVLDHYNDIDFDQVNNPELDPRLRGDAGGGPGGPGGPGGTPAAGQKLNLTPGERDAVIAFLKTLTGDAVYTDKRWSDPFDAAGELALQ